MNYPWLEPRDIETAARGLLLKAFGAGWTRAACVDLEALVFDYLCEAEHLSFTDERDLGWEDGEQILGRTTPVPGKIEITASLKAPQELGRYRFTLAHEIGHWVLHRPLFLAAAESLDLFDGASRGRALTSLNRSLFPSGPQRRVPPEEWQANRFAIALLVDPDVLRDEFTRRFGAPVVALRSPGWRTRSGSLREHSRLLASCEANDHPPLCSVFGLSATSMAIGLEERGYSVEEVPML